MCRPYSLPFRTRHCPSPVPRPAKRHLPLQTGTAYPPARFRQQAPPAAFPVGRPVPFHHSGRQTGRWSSCRCPRQTGPDATRHLEFHPLRQPPYTAALPARNRSPSRWGTHRSAWPAALPHCAAPCRGLHPKPVPQPAGQHPPAASGLSAGQGPQGLATSAGNRLARTAAHWNGRWKKV